jgi:hypothetical protein
LRALLLMRVGGQAHGLPDPAYCGAAWVLTR